MPLKARGSLNYGTPCMRFHLLVLWRSLFLLILASVLPTTFSSKYYITFSQHHVLPSMWSLLVDDSKMCFLNVVQWANLPKCCHLSAVHNDLSTTYVSFLKLNKLWPCLSWVVLALVGLCPSRHMIGHFGDVSKWPCVNWREDFKCSMHSLLMVNVTVEIISTFCIVCNKLDRADLMHNVHSCVSAVWSAD